MINRKDGASHYDLQVDEALKDQKKYFIYSVIDIKDHRYLPRFLALIVFWARAQYLLFFGKIDLFILSPWMMLIYPKNTSIICISHHYDPSVFSGIRLLYVKFSHWLFIKQKSKVNLVVSCSNYWSNFYKKKGFAKTSTIYNGFDIENMINYTQNIESNSVLKKNNLVSKQYLHLGSYGFKVKKLFLNV